MYKAWGESLVHRYRVGVNEMHCEGWVKVLIVMGGVRFNHKRKSTNNMYWPNHDMPSAGLTVLHAIAHLHKLLRADNLAFFEMGREKGHCLVEIGSCLHCKQVTNGKKTQQGVGAMGPYTKNKHRVDSSHKKWLNWHCAVHALVRDSVGRRLATVVHSCPICKMQSTNHSHD